MLASDMIASNMDGGLLEAYVSATIDRPARRQRGDCRLLWVESMADIEPREKPTIDHLAIVPTQGRLDSLAAAVGATNTRGPAPVELWHPPFCGDIDMRIAADGTWFYAGTPIARPAMVALFARILRRDPERYVLVTPVECVGITVDDAPFVAVAMRREGGMAREGGTLRFVTNFGEEVEAGRDHPLRFATEPGGAGVKPYVHVRGDLQGDLRGGLWARLTRSLAIDLLDGVVEEDGIAGVRSGGMFFPIESSSPIASPGATV